MTRFAHLDATLDSLSLPEKLELQRRARVGALTLQEGDRVQAVRLLCGSHIDEALEDEGENFRVPYRVPKGALGRVALVRQHVTPFPYRVAFDDGVELSLAEGDIERVDG